MIPYILARVSRSHDRNNNGILRRVSIVQRIMSAGRVRGYPDLRGVTAGDDSLTLVEGALGSGIGWLFSFCVLRWTSGDQVCGVWGQDRTG